MGVQKDLLCKGQAARLVLFRAVVPGQRDPVSLLMHAKGQGRERARVCKYLLAACLVPLGLALVSCTQKMQHVRDHTDTRSLSV